MLDHFRKLPEQYQTHIQQYHQIWKYIKIDKIVENIKLSKWSKLSPKKEFENVDNVDHLDNFGKRRKFDNVDIC